MFSSLRVKLHHVQEEISTSLKSLKIDRHGIRRKSEEPKFNALAPVKPNVNFEAGMQLLELYEIAWSDIHRKTEQTATAAQVAAATITQLHRNYEDQWNKMSKLSAGLALIPKVVHGVQEVCDLILNVQCAFDETDEALLQLENMIETQELREKELEHQFQLALYRKKREDELDDLKVKLTNDHFVKIKEYEKRKALEMKMRQAYFQEAFEKDLEQYKDGSLVTRVDSRAERVSSPSLEEIELEEDTGVLEDFLADTEAGPEADEETTETETSTDNVASSLATANG